MTMAKRLLVGIAAAVMSAGLLVFIASPASACPGGVSGGSDDQGVDYGSSCPGNDSNGNNSNNGSGGGEPSCDLSTAPYTEFCRGTVACWGNDPAVNDEAKAESLGAGPKPSDEHHLAYTKCADGTSEWFWSTDTEGPSTPDLARQAFGALTFPTYSPVFNPPNRTFVNLPTWWWAEGATTDELTGTSAGTVRAIATPNRMEVDPGDGSGVLSCPFVVAKSDTCSYTYQRASVRGTASAPDGSAAYSARIRLVYDLVIEDGGTPITVAGIPAVFASPWQAVAVPVREVQTVVRPRR